MWQAFKGEREGEMRSTSELISQANIELLNLNNVNCVFQDGNSNQGTTAGSNSGSHTPGEPVKENSNKV